jgi:hypothetical protein
VNLSESYVRYLADSGDEQERAWAREQENTIMNTDTVHVPCWLDSSVVPTHLIPRIRAAIDAASQLSEPVMRFVAEHGPTFVDYEQWYDDTLHGQGTPDEVAQVIDEVTGFKRLHSLITTPGDLLASLDRPAERVEAIDMARARLTD